MTQTYKGYFFLALALIFEVITFVLSEYILQYTTPLNFAVHFLVSTLVVITPFYFFYYGKKTLYKTWRKRWRDIGRVSFWFVLVALLFFFVVDAVGSTSIALFEKFSIVFSALIGIFMLKEKVTPLETGGIFLCFLGAIGLAIEDFQLQGLAVLMGMGYAVVISIISYSLKRYVGDIDTTLFNFYRIWLMSLVIVVLAFLFSGVSLLPWPLVGWSLLAGLCGVMGGAQFLMHSHKFLPITAIHALSSVLPFLVALTTYLVFGSIPGYLKIIGGILIVVGVILIILYRHADRELPYEGEIAV